MDSDAIPPLPAVGAPPNTTEDTANNTDDGVVSYYARPYYERGNNAIQLLIAMAVGLKDDEGSPLFDENQEPWSSSHLKVREWKPSVDQLRAEVLRRYDCYCFADLLNNKRPLNKSWTVKKCMDWLIQHPINWEDKGITDAALDVLFVSDEMSNRKALAMDGINAIEEQNAALEGRWSGSQPMLRLIHTVVDHDDIKLAFLHRSDSLARPQLENRNSTDKRDRTCWELMSDKWNDKSYNPETMVFLTEGQYMFRDKIDLSYSTVQHLAAATPDKCKTKMNEMMGQLKRIIQNWEASGQGDGGKDYDEDNPVQFDLGVLCEGRSEYAVASRAHFFKYKEMYLLYLWDVAELFDLTRSCMQTLDPTVAAGDGGKDVPSVFEQMDEFSIGSLDSKSNNDSKGSKAIADIAANLKEFNKRAEALQKFEKEEKEKDRKHATNERTFSEYHSTKERISREIESLEKEKRGYEWKLLKSKRQRLDDSDEDPIAQSMQEFVDSIGVQLANKKKELADLHGRMNAEQSTPQKSNVTPTHGSNKWT
jgi:hypothetical protein